MLVLGLVDLPWWAIILLLLLTFYLYETRHYDFFKRQGIPYLKPIPILGSALHLMRGIALDDPAHCAKYHERGYYGEYMSDSPTLIVFDEAFLADVLVKESSSFVNRMAMNDPDSLSAKMVANARDEQWKNLRTQMTPTFTSGKLKMMTSEINRCAKLFGNYLLGKAETGESINIKEYCGAYTMDVISTTAFGIQLNSLEDTQSPFLKHAKKAFELNNTSLKFLFTIFFPVLTKILRKVGVSIEPNDKDAENFFLKVTEQAIEMRKSGNDQSRTDFLQLMINAERDNDSSHHKGMSKEEMLANALSFFPAGYDTAASTLTFLMYSLATNPDVQDKLIAEIDRVAKNEESVDYDLLKEMPYLDQCISETLRMYSPALRTTRVANRDITLHGVFIKKDMLVTVPIYAIHHDPLKWPNPEVFDPERFSAENKNNRSPYHYLPFGGGPRICIAMRLALLELKVAVVHMLKHVTVQTSDKTEIPVKFENTAILRPHNVMLKVVRR